MSNQHSPRFAKETLQGRLTSQASCSQLRFYQRKCHNQRRQITLAIITTKTIEKDHRARLTVKIGLQISPCSSIHLERYGTIALSQKGNACIQVIFTQSPVSLTTTPEYLPVSGFNVPSLHLSQSSRLHPFQVSQTTATIQTT